jgi:hypothetical protein
MRAVVIFVERKPRAARNPLSTELPHTPNELTGVEG